MSITFSPTRIQIGWHVLCAFDATLYPDRTSHTHPLTGGCVSARTFLDVCEDAGYATAVALYGHPVNERECDESTCLRWSAGLDATTPAYAEVPETLGIPEGSWCGALSATDFLGRVLVAQGLHPGDPGRPVEVTRGARGATVIDCGRREGYVQIKLGALSEVACYAKAAGLDVQWG
jgi:hypothetical protein